MTNVMNDSVEQGLIDRIFFFKCDIFNSVDESLLIRVIYQISNH